MMDNITLVASLRQWRWFVLSAFKLSVPTPVGQVPKWAFLWLTRNAYLCLWHVRTSSLLPRKCFLSHGCMALTICIECTIHITGRGCWAVFMPPLWKDKYNLSDHQIVIWISQTQPKLLQILRRQCCQKHTAILSISCVCWKAVIDLHMWTYLHPHQSSENSWSDLFTPAHPIAGELFKDMVLLGSLTCKDSRLSCLQTADLSELRIKFHWIVWFGLSDLKKINVLWIVIL